MHVISCIAAFPGRFLWEDLHFAACSDLRRKSSRCCAGIRCILWQLWSLLQFSSFLFTLVLYATYKAITVVSSGTYLRLLRWKKLTHTNHRSLVRPQLKLLSGFTRIFWCFFGRIYRPVHQLSPFFNQQIMWLRKSTTASANVSYANCLGSRNLQKSETLT